MADTRRQAADTFGSEGIDIPIDPETGIFSLEVQGVGPAPPTVFPPEKETPDSSVIRRGLTSGVIKGAPVAAAFAAGLPLSISAAAASGPLAPLTFILGMGASLYAGTKASQSLTGLTERFAPELIEEPENREQMPLYRGAETFGLSGAMSASAPFLTARRLATPTSGSLADAPAAITNFFTQMTSAYGRAARQPGVLPRVLFSTGEATSGLGAAAGSYAAEKYFPQGVAFGDSTDPTVSPAGVKFLFELSGGLLPSLSKTLTRAVADAAPVLDPRNWRDFSKKMGERQAADTLYRIINDPELQKLYGENPAELMRRLTETGLLPSGAEGTASQFTGSLTLSALEAGLARQSAKFGGDVVKKGEDAMRAYKGLIEAMVGTDNPALIRAAAEMERRRQTELMDARFAIAANQLQDQRDRLTPLVTKDPAGREISTREAIGRQMEGAVVNALKDFRASENELYEIAFKRMFRGARGDKQRVVPKNVVPQNAMIAFLEDSVPLGSSGYDNVLAAIGNSKLAEDLSSILGGKVDPEMFASNLQTYRDGSLTRDYLANRMAYRQGQIDAPIPVDYLNAIDISKVPVAQLQTWRSALLERGRVLSAQGEYNGARIVRNIADGLLKDMEKAKIPELREALSFSRTLNDYFSRSFPAEVTAKAAEGGMKHSPEELVSMAFKTLGKAANESSLRMMEVEDAIKIAEWERLTGPGKGLASRNRFEEAMRTGDNVTIAELLPIAKQVDASSKVNSILDAQRRFFEQDFRRKFTTQQMPNPLDPSRPLMDRGQPIDFTRINPADIQRYVQDNKILLDKLGLTDTFQDIGRLENAFKFFTSNQNLLAENLQTQQAFSQALQPGAQTSAVDIVRNALGSNDPARRFGELVTMAGQVPGAKDGLKNAVYSLMFERAGGFRKQTFPDPANPGRTVEIDTPSFNAEEFKRFLMPSQPGKPSVFGMMRQNNMLAPGEEARLREIIKRIEYTQRAVGARQTLDQIIDPASLLDDFVNRAAGAAAGGALVPEGPGSLVAAGAGSRIFRKIFEGMPAGQAQLILQEAAANKDVMAALMRKGVTRNAQANIAQRAVDILLSVGAGPIAASTTNVLAQPDYEETPPGSFGAEARAPQRPMLTARAQPPAPPARGLPGFPKAVSPGGQRPTAQGGAPQPQAREMLQRLFPFDAVLR